MTEREIRTDEDKEKTRAEDEQDEEEDATDLPKREAMSLLVDPGALLGGGLVPNAPGSAAAPGAGTPGAGTPQAAPTPGSDVPTPGGTVHVPNVPVPEQNPGGTYNPDTSTTSKG